MELREIYHLEAGLSRVTLLLCYYIVHIILLLLFLLLLLVITPFIGDNTIILILFMVKSDEDATSDLSESFAIDKYIAIFFIITGL